MEMQIETAEGRSSESVTEFAQIIRMENVNGAGRLFGGYLMTWMDEIAAVSARRYAKGAVTTACVEKLRFLRPAYCNETLVITGRVIYTGKTSMEVLVNAEIERFSKERALIADSHVILVALDDDEKPRAVPKLIPETEQEKAWYEETKARREREK